MGKNSIFVNLFLVHEILQDEGLDKQEVVAELPEDQPEVIPEASIGKETRNDEHDTLTLKVFEFFEGSSKIGVLLILKLNNYIFT